MTNKMPLEDFLTLEFLGFLVAILVPFGIAMYRLGVLDTKVQSLVKDVEKLQNEVRETSIKLGAYTLARKELSRSGEDRNE
jgi:hypothetical protein